MQDHEKAWVVIPAAGVGKRMQANKPKQYLELLGKTVIEHTLNCFFSYPNIAGVVVVISSGDEYWQDITLPDVSMPVHIAEGGKERADSVLNGLSYLADNMRVDEQTWVMVHDAARPCLTHQELDCLFANGSLDDIGGILATPVRDTMKRQKEGETVISHTEDREGMWHALTPQMFRLGQLKTALSSALEKELAVTDEASAMEFAGYSPSLIEGLETNLKITRPADLALAEFFLRRKK
jgi:2-C-methyl-D-erythritol 4-phosphate cytidylyltransferase